MYPFYSCILWICFVLEVIPSVPKMAFLDPDKSRDPLLETTNSTQTRASLAVNAQANNVPNVNEAGGGQPLPTARSSGQYDSSGSEWTVADSSIPLAELVGSRENSIEQRRGYQRSIDWERRGRWHERRSFCSPAPRSRSLQSGRDHYEGVALPFRWEDEVWLRSPPGTTPSLQALSTITEQKSEVTLRAPEKIGDRLARRQRSFSTPEMFHLKRTTSEEEMEKEAEWMRNTPLPYPIVPPYPPPRRVPTPPGCPSFPYIEVPVRVSSIPPQRGILQRLGLRSSSAPQISSRGRAQMMRRIAWRPPVSGFGSYLSGGLENHPFHRAEFAAVNVAEQGEDATARPSLQVPTAEPCEEVLPSNPQSANLPREPDPAQRRRESLGSNAPTVQQASSVRFGPLPQQRPSNAPCQISRYCKTHGQSDERRESKDCWKCRVRSYLADFCWLCCGWIGESESDALPVIRVMRPRPNYY
ncbi:hypothetical protein L228DRAFT_56950 [Xylona heveae TC161]|uniref:Uncharacterized protein n=1 Tax=Xylona heveae (strain CBS 132557 / TC161) TaxID=1328760 RepID=A0A165IFX6_XYLHT|nr:hypothetical protein L228DRAFT_56950 [Xylona heveae TC161]KZF24842.1 hypothetical protein L228DRAFT_56950 [Xylona heveae TC161]